MGSGTVTRTGLRRPRITGSDYGSVA